MSSNIPLARNMIHEARQLLFQALKLMRREASDRPKTTRKSRRIDPDTAEKVRGYARRNANKSIQEIAVHFKTNSGRVSEAIRNKR